MHGVWEVVVCGMREVVVHGGEDDAQLSME